MKDFSHLSNTELIRESRVFRLPSTYLWALVLKSFEDVQAQLDCYQDRDTIRSQHLNDILDHGVRIERVSGEI